VAAGFMLRLIGNLYHMEHEWDDRGLAWGASALRQRDFEVTLRLLRKAAVLLLALEAEGAAWESVQLPDQPVDTLVAHCEHGCTRSTIT